MATAMLSKKRTAYDQLQDDNEGTPASAVARQESGADDERQRSGEEGSWPPSPEAVAAEPGTPEGSAETKAGADVAAGEGFRHLPRRGNSREGHSKVPCVVEMADLSANRPKAMDDDVNDIEPQVESDDAKSHTIGELLERLGMGRFGWRVVRVSWMLFFVAGWQGSMIPFLLDAAGDPDGDWARNKGQTEILTMVDKGIIMVMGAIGGMVGNLLLGHVSDAYGRVIALVLIVGACMVTGVGIALSPSKTILFVLLTVNPFSRDGLCMIVASMLVEWLPTAQRSVHQIFLHAVWNMARLVIVVWWTICSPDDHWTIFFLVCVTVPACSFAWLVARGWRYEPSRWLAVNGHTANAIRNIRLAAKVSRREGRLPAGWDDPEKLRVSSDGGGTVHMERSSNREDLCNCATMALIVGNSAVVIILSFSSVSLFVWALEYFRRIGAKDAIEPAMAAAPVAKIFINSLMVVGGPGRCIVDTVPHVWLIRFGLLSFGLAIILLTLVGTYSTVLIVLLMYVCNCCDEIVWAVQNQYMIECFPTTVRNTAMGIAYTAGHLGTLCASGVGPAMDWWSPEALFYFFGAISVGGAVIAMLLPDRGAESVSDTMRVGEKKPKAEEMQSLPPEPVADAPPMAPNVAAPPLPKVAGTGPRTVASNENGHHVHAQVLGKPDSEESWH